MTVKAYGEFPEITAWILSTESRRQVSRDVVTFPVNILEHKPAENDVMLATLTFDGKLFWSGRYLFMCEERWLFGFQVSER